MATDGTQTMKEEGDWMKEAHKLALHNSKALKAILGDKKVKDDQDLHLGCDDVEPNSIAEVVKTEKVAAEIFETLVEESVTLCVSNTVKTLADIPSVNGTWVVKNTLATREACTLETTDVSRNVVPTVVQHVADEVHKKNNPTEEIMHTRIMTEEDVTPCTGDTVVDTTEVPSFENFVKSVVSSVEDTIEEVPRWGDVVPPDVDTIHASDPIMKDVEKDVTTSVVSIAVGNSGVEDTLNDVETEMYIPNYTTQEKKKKSNKRMHKGGDK
ncbi:hypothetical protein LIER_39801 [Lithospermum erythrorhizon]|uniref:Uncharacterized protein n=1 Tax=Lithospermum erythrorhizon TaxID=34254 RepID=A0AAV3QK95_LITER